ncbi:MAG: caspase family protein [Bacteroidales bacterium]|nr:caspase family protein [Bacteroidales bacterium]
MRKIITLLIVISFWMNTYAQKKQILIASDGSNATFDISLKKHEDKKVVVVASVSWVNEDLQTIENENSLLVLNKSGITINADQPVNIEEFKENNEVRFHDKTELHLSYEGSEIQNLDIEIIPLYSAQEIGKTEDFLLSHPQKLVKSFANLSAPQIVITNPENNSTDRGMKHLVENEKITLKGYVTSKSPLTKFTVAGIPVSLSEKGEFEYEMTMAKKGETRVWLEAQDTNKNASSLKLTLDYRPPLTEQDLSEIDYYALIIAVEQYKDQMIVDLDFPIDDATALAEILTQKYDFQWDKITLLKDATNKQIVKSLDSLSSVITNFDNLLIFYAGHGYWDEKTEIGYWIPSDAEFSDKSTWFRNSSLRDHINSIKSNHTLLIADACFSGGIFKTRGAFDNASYAITKLYNMPSRKAMTSGTLKEVPDKSVFIKYFLKRLQENDKTFISAAELFNSFREAVLNNSPNIPQYGMIQNSGDEGGEFIFIKK